MTHDIETIWKRLKQLEGQEFRTIRGLPFTFKINKDYLVTDRTNYNLSKTDFSKALKLVLLKGPGFINDLVRGPSYIWAILHDNRVREENW